VVFQLLLLVVFKLGCSDIVGEYGVRPLYRMLGYFSIIGLLRVHVLLGDFTLALKVMDNVELNQKVPLCLVHLSFCSSTILGTFHSSNSLSRCHVLLRRLLLYYARPISRCNTHICHNLKLHNADAAIPHPVLPI
jgi:hypothetical protein